MKKLTRILLAMLLIMSMVIPAYAAEYTYDSDTGVISGSYMDEEEYKKDKSLGINTYVNGELTGSNTITTKEMPAATYEIKTYLNGKEVYNDTIKAVRRVAGQNRYGTSIAAADALKVKLGVSKFDTVIVAYGDNFADALSGTYLAGVKSAPIILVNKNTETQAIDKVKADLKAGGQVYILGGEYVVSKNVETSLSGAGFKVKRLAGQDRYGTNLAILREAGVKSGDILVCSGTNFADALSASAASKPIMLVGKDLTAAQKSYLGTLSGEEFDIADFHIVGGTFAVSQAVETGLKKYGVTERVAGQTRFDTSVEVAKKYFGSKVDTVVLAYGKNFPDGLSGGPLGVAYDAPVLLVTDKDYSAAAAYAKSAGVGSAVIMGGKLVISDATAKAIVG